MVPTYIYLYVELRRDEILIDPKVTELWLV